MAEKNRTSPLAATWHGLKAYLTDWRNLLGHGLIGIAFLVLAIWAPIEIWIKLLVIAALICFNVVRMRRKNRKKAAASASIIENIPLPEQA